MSRLRYSTSFVVLLGTFVAVDSTRAAFLRGDANQDEAVDISDSQFILRFLFLGGEEPECLAAADVNDDENVDISDAVAGLEYLFLGGSAPPPPFPDAGTDPTPGVGCANSEEPENNQAPEITVLAPRVGAVSSSGRFTVRFRIDDDSFVSRVVVGGNDVDVSNSDSLPRTVTTSVNFDSEPSRVEILSIEVVDEFGRATFAEVPVGIGNIEADDARIGGLAVSIESPSGFDEIEGLLRPFLAGIPSLLNDSLRGVEVFRGNIGGVDIRVNGRSVELRGETAFTLEPTGQSGGRLRLSVRFPEVIFVGDGVSDFGFLGTDSWTATWTGRNLSIVGTVRFDPRANGQGVDVRSDGFVAQIESSNFSVSGFLDPFGIFDAIVNSLSGLFEDQIEASVRSAVEDTANNEIVPILADAFGALAIELGADPIGLSTAIGDIIETSSNLVLRFDGAWNASERDELYPRYPGFGAREAPLPSFPLPNNVSHAVDAAISLSLDSLDQALAALVSTGALGTRFDLEVEDAPIPVTTGGLAKLIEPRWLRLGDVEPDETPSFVLSVRSPPRFVLTESERSPIVRAGSSWRYFAGTSEPPDNWMEPEFRDQSWSVGASGFGYSSNAQELSRVRTQPSGMSEGNFTSLYLRRTFTLRDRESLPGVTLRLEYDDAFVAYLNGEEIARSNVEGSPPAYDALAESAGEPRFVDIDLNAFPDVLRDGLNLLAIQGHNASDTSSDFILTPEVLPARPLPSGGRDALEGELIVDNFDVSVQSGDVELFACRVAFRLSVRVVFGYDNEGIPVLLFDLDPSDGPDEDELPDAIVDGAAGISIEVARESYDTPDGDLVFLMQTAIALLGSGLSEALESLELPAIPLPRLEFDLSGDGSIDTRLAIVNATLTAADGDRDGDRDWICLLSDLVSESAEP